MIIMIIITTYTGLLIEGVEHGGAQRLVHHPQYNKNNNNDNNNNDNNNNNTYGPGY